MVDLEMDTDELFILGGHSSPHTDLDSTSFAPLPVGNPEAGHFANVASPDANSFDVDFTLLPQNLPDNVTNHHTLTETFSLPDDINFDDGIRAVGSNCNQFLLDEVEFWQSIYKKTEEVLMSSEDRALDLAGSARETDVAFPPMMTENLMCDPGKRPMIEHQQNRSLNSCTAGMHLDIVASSSGQPSQVYRRNGMSDNMLVGLSNVDPKRAKRIMANRRSAAKSKQKRLQYISELEKNLETMMAEKTIMSAQLTLLQEENSVLSQEINELNLRLEMQDEYNRLTGVSCHVLQEMLRQNERGSQATDNGDHMMNCASSSSGSNQ